MERRKRRRGRETGRRGDRWGGRGSGVWRVYGKYGGPGGAVRPQQRVAGQLVILVVLVIDSVHVLIIYNRVLSEWLHILYLF